MNNNPFQWVLEMTAAYETIKHLPSVREMVLKRLGNAAPKL